MRCNSCGRWLAFFGVTKAHTSRAYACHYCKRVALVAHDSGTLLGTVTLTDQIVRMYPHTKGDYSADISDIMAIVPDPR